MKGRRTRVARWAAFGLLVAALSFVAAGCGGGDDESSGGSSELEGLGTSFEEIQELAREEGQVNIVQWPLYAQLVDEFTEATGCKVTLKDANTSDDMITFMGTGEYDGIVASGNATVRLMTTGEVAPIERGPHPELRRHLRAAHGAGAQLPRRPGDGRSSRTRLQPARVAN